MSTVDRLAEVGAAAARARVIAAAGGLGAALDSGMLPQYVDVSVAEAVVLGLLHQGVSKYLAIFGHGSTTLGDALRVYELAGLVRTFDFHNEVSMAHAATVMRWQYGETPALVTSIGPGALQAMAGSLTSLTNRVGLYHIYGDETTYGEGYNFQQIPKREQHLFSRITATLGESYLLHTPQAVRDMLRRGAARVHHPFRAGPFFIHLPMNVQPASLRQLNLRALPVVPRDGLGPPAAASLDDAAALILRHSKITIKAGGGARSYGSQVRQLAERIGAAVVTSPVSQGLLPDDHPQHLHVSGSKGTLSGNFAAENAELLIVVGSRAVCQADCSGIGYKSAQAVINMNADWDDANHYNRTTALIGDIGSAALQLCERLEDWRVAADPERSAWLTECLERKRAWCQLRRNHYERAAPFDPVWGRAVLTQPTAIKVVVDFAKSVDAVKYFDSGDVQSNALQVCEDDTTEQTFTDGGASYMGFAVSALLASALADTPRYGIAVSGDGAFWMNPQVLIDAVKHRARGMIVLLDNRRMGAISTLQSLQYAADYKTSDAVAVNYARLASGIEEISSIDGGNTRESLWDALGRAYRHEGLSIVHVPVYWSAEGDGNLGAYGQWNVGNWCADVQDEYLAQNL